MIFYILSKYWKKHVKSALAILFSGILLAAIIFVTLMSIRAEYVTAYNESCDMYGNYEVVIKNSDDDILKMLTNGNSGCNFGSITVFGELGNEGMHFAYGTIEDEYNIWHIPISEGRMPETADEIAADKGALDKLFWAGKCGDTINLNGKTYTVVGIIGEEYGSARETSQLGFNATDFAGNELDPFHIPLIFVGECSETPSYRIDFLNNVFKATDAEQNCRELLRGVQKDIRYNFRSDGTGMAMSNEENLSNFFLLISVIGAGISALSVYSVLKSVFDERRSRINILRRIGMSKRRVYKMYALECAILTVIQIVLGISLGAAAYQGIFLFRANVLEEKVFSGYTDVSFILKQTLDPFLFSAIISSVIIAAAYFVVCISEKPRRKKNALLMKLGRLLGKLKRKRVVSEARKLSKNFSRVFSQRSVTITQTAALTLICFSTLLGYLYFTDNGKTTASYVMYTRSNVPYTANGLDMEDYGISEYYSCELPKTSSISGSTQKLSFVNTDYSAGIDDSVADTLPDSAFVSGELSYTVISSGSKNYINKIDTSDEEFRQGLLALSEAEYQNFFEDGQLGAENLYNVNTKLAPANALKRLSDKVTDGKINLDGLNSGEEIIVAYTGVKPPFEIGEVVQLNTFAASETGYGIGGIASKEVKIGALVQIDSDEHELLSEVIRNRDPYNLLTTVSGAKQMGLYCAKYTDIYCAEPINGGLIPSGARMKLTSLEKLKHDNFINAITNFSGVILLLLLMCLLGFSAYFNAIGIKIRLKSYDISVMRAVGARISEIKRRLLINSIRTPLVSSLIAYIAVKITQLIMGAGYSAHVSFVENSLMTPGGAISSDLLTQNSGGIDDFLHTTLFLDRLMWQPNAEIPMLILFAVLCAVTFLLTVVALRKFKSNIAGDLSEGRTRQ